MLPVTLLKIKSFTSISQVFSNIYTNICFAQPVSLTTPKRISYGSIKNYRRSHQKVFLIFGFTHFWFRVDPWRKVSWIQTKPWYVYSKELQGSLCKYVYYSTKIRDRNLEVNLTWTVFQDVGKQDKVAKHETKIYHKDALENAKDFLESLGHILEKKGNIS